jgi:hypothetical protein
LLLYLVLLGLGLLMSVVGLVMSFITGIDIVAGLVLIGSLIFLAVGVRVFAQRGKVLDRALARTRFSREGCTTGLAEVAGSLDHVLCTTELQAGEH